METLKDMFPDWSDSDLASVYEEAKYDLHDTISRIAEGNADKWDVSVKGGKKKKVPAPPAAPAVAGNIKQISQNQLNSKPKYPVKIEQQNSRPQSSHRSAQMPRFQQINHGSAVPSASVDSNKSWAQLVKGPEIVPVDDIAPESPATPSPLLPQRSPSPVAAARSPSPVRLVTPISPSQQYGNTTPSSLNNSSSPVQKFGGVGLPQNQQFHQQTFQQPQYEPQQFQQPTANRQSPDNKPKPRILNQEAAVVMPTNSTMSSLGVRFGSLGVGGTPVDPTISDESSVAKPPTQHILNPIALQQLAAANGFGFSNMPEYAASAYTDHSRMGYYADPNYSTQRPIDQQQSQTSASTATQSAASTTQPQYNMMPATPYYHHYPAYYMPPNPQQFAGAGYAQYATRGYTPQQYTQHQPPQVTAKGFYDQGVDHHHQQQQQQQQYQQFKDFPGPGGFGGGEGVNQPPQDGVVDGVQQQSYAGGKQQQQPPHPQRFQQGYQGQGYQARGFQQSWNSGGQ